MVQDVDGAESEPGRGRPGHEQPNLWFRASTSHTLRRYRGPTDYSQEIVDTAPCVTQDLSQSTAAAGTAPGQPASVRATARSQDGHSFIHQFLPHESPSPNQPRRGRGPPAMTDSSQRSPAIIHPCQHGKHRPAASAQKRLLAPAVQPRLWNTAPSSSDCHYDKRQASCKPGYYGPDSSNCRCDKLNCSDGCSFVTDLLSSCYTSNAHHRVATAGQCWTGGHAKRLNRSESRVKCSAGEAPPQCGPGAGARPPRVLSGRPALSAASTPPPKSSCTPAAPVPQLATPPDQCAYIPGARNCFPVKCISRYHTARYHHDSS